MDFSGVWHLEYAAVRRGRPSSPPSSCASCGGGETWEEDRRKERGEGPRGEDERARG